MGASANRMGSARQALIEAVIAQRLAGRKCVDIAREFGLSKVTVYQYLHKYIKSNPDAPPILETKHLCIKPASVDDIEKHIGNYKRQLKAKSIKALHAGLDAKKDPYKRATIAVRVLTGIGEFAAPAASQGISVLLSQVPAGLEQYFTIHNEDNDLQPKTDGGKAIDVESVSSEPEDSE